MRNKYGRWLAGLTASMLATGVLAYAQVSPPATWAHDGGPMQQEPKNCKKHPGDPRCKGTQY